MKYSVKHLRWKGTFWECTLMRWKGCECTAESTKVVIHKERRPSLKEIKDCAVWS